MRILGIDPGLQRTGFGVIEAYGPRLAYVASDGNSQQIHVRYLDSGASVRVTQLTQAPQGLSWSPDGRWIAFSARVPSKGPSLAEDMPAAPEGAT